VVREEQRNYETREIREKEMRNGMARANRKKTRRKKGMPEIPVNSFADIAFLLIVFFFVAATLIKTKGVITDIPSGETSEAKEEKTAVVQLTEDRMTLNDTDIDLATLRKRLAEMKLNEKTGDDRVVILETAGVIEYQAYYGVMTAISGAGGVVALVKESDD